MKRKGLRKTKELLIEKGIDFFYEKGYSRSSVRDIVKAADVTNSALYTYFHNKEELLYQIIKKEGEDLLSILAEIEKRHEHPLDRLKWAILTQICKCQEKKKEVKIYLDELYQLNQGLKTEISEQHRMIFEFYKKQFSDLEKLGLLRVTSKALASFACLSIINWSYRWFREDGELSIEQVANKLIDLFFYGILNDQKES